MTKRICNLNQIHGFFILATLLATSLFAASEEATQPSTERKPVSDQYYDVSITDDYRWLENFEDPAVKGWNAEQNAFTRHVLDAIPARSAIQRQLSELLGGTSTDYYGLNYSNGKLFAIKFQPPAQQPFLITLDSPDDQFSEKIILDVNKLNPDGTTSMDFYRPTLDGKLIAVSLSEKGSEKGTVRIFEVATGRELGDTVPRVNGPTAGGDVAWSHDNSGFFYTRYPRPGERPDEDLSFYQQVFYHKLGTNTSEDTYAIGKEFPRIAEIELNESEDHKLFIAAVSDGDGGEYSHFYRDESGKWIQITGFKDLIPVIEFAPDNSLYILSRKDAPMGKILRLAPNETDMSKAVVFVPEGNLSIKSFLATKDYFFLTEMDGGPIRLRALKLDGQEHYVTPIQPVRSIGSVLSVEGDDVLLRVSSYTEASAWYRFDPEAKEMTRTALFKTSPADFSDVEVVREFATSKDGTKVPMNIIRSKGTKLDGANPTILYGYGGYGISMSPGFDPSLRLWMDQGGVYVIANLRGGGEYGEEWHLAGNLTRKQNVFDDFAACAKWLIENKYTNSSRLCIKGGSNGGLLMGATFTQHPELFGACVSYVGIYDMLRVELDPNGEFNITEFGTVKNPEHFEALRAYSPYHNVKDNTAYPGIMFITGDHDGRVNPSQSRKMTAFMQSASTSGKPILLRTSARAGHGGGTALNDLIERETDAWSFIVNQLGVEFHYDK